MSRLLDLAPNHRPLALMLEGQLEEVAYIIERQLASDLPAVNALCKHVERYRGKMLRPTMVMLSGLAVQTATDANGDPDGTLTEAHRVVAAVAELIHMATLVHDDVLDEAEVRRRGATVNHLRGNETAVMLGDYLISNAFHLCSTLGDPAINLALGEVTNTLCAGELLQLHHREHYGLDEQTYFEIVARKTASLIGECCRQGARLSGATPETAERLRQVGISLGIAFQVQDDLLDLIGEQAVVGKSLGRDLDKGKLTLPLILHLGEIGATERGDVLDMIRQRDLTSLRGRLIESGAVDASRARATALVDEARLKLGMLPDNAARELLDTLALSLVDRSF